MKKGIVLILAAAILLCITACDGLAFKTSEFKVIATPDKNGNVIKEDYYTWVGGNFSGEYELRSTIEYDHDEQGNVKEKRIYRDIQGYNGQGGVTLVQRNEYTYDANGKKQQIKLYDRNDDHFCTAEYAYDSSGAIESKKATFINLKLRLSSQGTEGEDGEWTYTNYARYSLPEYIYVSEDFTRNIFLHNKLMESLTVAVPLVNTTGGWLLDDVIDYEDSNEPTADPSLTYTMVVEYYPNGTEKRIFEYKNDVLRSKTEYPYQENVEDYISDESGLLVSLNTGILSYEPGDDGTYSTTGWWGTKTYTYFEDGELKRQDIYDENGEGNAEEYYPGGKIKTKVEANFTEDGKARTKTEEYYENGVLAFYSESIYTGDSFQGQYASYYGERYYESGAKMADFRYDPEESVIVTTKYDEEGNVIEQSKEEYKPGILTIPVVTE